MRNIEAREILRETYASFLRVTEHSTFHRLEWLEAVEATYGARLMTLGFFCEGTLIAVCPALGRRMGPFRIWGSPLRKTGIPAATPYCAPRVLGDELLPALHAWVRRTRIRYFQITTAVTNASGGCDRSEDLNNLEVDLDRPLEAIWKDLSDLPRRCVRKAIRASVRVHWLCGESALAAQNALVNATYATQHIAPNVPQRLYAELFARRRENGLRILSATHAGRTIATIWIFADADRCYYWDAAALPEARELNANHLLVWTLIRWAHRSGLRTLDFVGSGMGRDAGSRPGIGRFKQSMGARLVQYRILYWHSRLLQLALTGYRLLQRLRALNRRKGETNVRRN